LLNSLQSVDAKADKLNEFEFYLGEPDSFRKVLDMYRAATPQAVRNAVNRTLDPNERLIIRVLPQRPAPEQNPRDKQPQGGEEVDFVPPAPREFTLSNGVKVFYWNRPELPLMSIATMLRGGSAIDPADKAGRMQMTAGMLDEGAASRNAQQFETALDNLGATFSASSGQQAVTAQMSVIANNFSPALALYADALLRPRFDPVEWERFRRVTIAGLEQQLDDPQAVAGRVALREYFGWHHPYGRPVSGTPETLRSLAIDDLRSAYSRVFQPRNAAIFVAGSLPEAQVRQELEKALAPWKDSGDALPEVIYPAPANEKYRVVVVDKPGAVQTVIRFIMPAPAYADERRIPLEALGTILGGSFTSRLNQNLREEKGYTYGAGSRFVFEPQLGYLIANSSVRADVTGASVQEFLKEFEALRVGIEDEEAEKARSIARAGVVESMGSLQSTLGTAIRLYLHGRPFSSLSEDLRAIAGLTAVQLNALAGASLPLDQGVLVLVGDRATILKQIEGLDLPEPQIVTP
jgi:zinc protease